MNARACYPPISLIAINQEAWKEESPNNGVSLYHLAEETARFARKMAKGLSIRDVRTSLHALSGQIYARVDDCPPLPRVSWDVPSDLLPRWDALLITLARRRAAAAAEQLGKKHVLPFMPAIFPPFRDDRPEAGAYGFIDIESHIQELDSVGRIPHSSEDENGLQEVIGARLEQFQAARDGNSGIIEYVRSYRINR